MVKPAPEDPDEQVPADLFDQLPLEVRLLRKIPGPDRDDYWLVEGTKPIAWFKAGKDASVTHLIVGTMFQGDSLQSEDIALAPENREVVRVLFGTEWGASLSTGERIVVHLSYGLDPSLKTDTELSFSKCLYIGAAVVEAIRTN
jgi:hypothetical protein